jgi:hypothetical protein
MGRFLELMGRSIDYINTTKAFDGFFQDDATMVEDNIMNLLRHILVKNQELLTFEDNEGVYTWFLNEDIILKAEYDPHVKFESHFVKSVSCDGEYMEFANILNQIAGEIIAGNVPVKHRDKFIEGVPLEIKYHLGDIVLVDEFGSFGNPPQITFPVRFTAVQPFKVEIKPQKRTLIL